jgi:DNA-binding NarL/FixJ family response regulator
VDPVRSLATTARLVRNAHAGVVVSADGSAEPLPGMDGHPLLAAGSPALAAAWAQLAPGELVVLGLLVDGRSNREIACALVVALRTVAAHIEHILVKLVTPTRTLAAVRAEEAGLYVPCVPRLARGEAQ